MAYKQITAILDLNKRVTQLCIKRERGFQKPWQILCLEKQKTVKRRNQMEKRNLCKSGDNSKISNCSWQKKKKNLPKYRTSTAAVISLFCFIDIKSIVFLKSVMETRLPSVIPKKKGCGKTVCIIHASLFCADTKEGITFQSNSKITTVMKLELSWPTYIPVIPHPFSRRAPGITDVPVPAPSHGFCIPAVCAVS